MSKVQKIIALVSVAVLVVVGIFVKFFSEKTEVPMEGGEKIPTNTQKEQNTNPIAPENGKLLKTTTSYKNPSGSDEVGFTVVVDGSGIITDVTTDILAENKNSKMFQENFSKALPQAIRGKKLSDLEAIDRVGGASLTTKAFNESLAKLKSDI